LDKSLQIKFYDLRFAYFAITFAIITSSCNSTKFLKEDEVFLNQLELIIENNETINDPAALKSELEQFYAAEPNKKFLLTGRQWYYYRNSGPEDTTWIKKWRKNKIGEEPSLLNEPLMQKSAKDMRSYLRNKKGFYEAEVDYDINFSGKLANVKFKVDPGQRYFIKNLVYESKDSNLITLIKSLSTKSVLKTGDPIDAYTFDLEKQRLVSELQNRGYADFNLNHITIIGDSTDLDHKIDIGFEILKPANDASHKKYSIGDIDIYTDYHQFQRKEDLVTETLFSKNFHKQSKLFLVKPKTIDTKIFIKPFEVYKAENYYKTLRKLYNLNTYKFVKLSPSVNPQHQNQIDYKIFLTPENSKWVFESGTDIFYSNIQNSDRNKLVGFAFGAGFENRNTFRGSETYKVSIDAGVEFNASTDTLINTLTIGFNNSLDIPKFTKTLNSLRFLHKVGLISDKALSILKDEGSSRVSLGTNYIDIFDRYNIFSVQANYGYEIPINKRNRLVFNQIGFTYSAYETLPGFQATLDRNPAVDSSFQNSFFSGIFFKDLTYYYQTDRGANKVNWAFIASLELSGTEIHLANQVSNLFSPRNNEWKLNNQTDFEKFIKLNLDLRWYKKLFGDSQIAARIKGGAAIPFGQDKYISFVKQYLVGGPSSIRAFRPMEVGPGDYNYISPPGLRNTFFQRGDINIEFNAEYRFDLFWFVEAGLFFDGGNIWTFREDLDRPGGQISSDFYKQFALGYGYGLRFDFNYFLIRFDFGFKLRAPSDNGFQWQKLKGQGVVGNPNIAVNYPF